MPVASNSSLNSLARILIYGDVKTKKTWWAISAAAAGFNVTLLDGDNGHHIIAKMDKKVRERIAYLSLLDKTDDAVFYSYLARMYKQKPIAFNENDRRAIFAKDKGQYRDEHSHVYFDPMKLTSNDVLIIDSWSAFCRSMEKHWNIQNDTNEISTGSLKERDIGRNSWENYGWAKTVSTNLLTMMQQLPCHVVLIAHSMEHVVYDTITNASGKKEQVVKEQTMQPLGYSGPQGKILGQFFSDILYFYIDKIGDYKISTKAQFDAVGGSRILDPAVYSWGQLTWEKYFELAGNLYTLPERGKTGVYNSEAFEFLAPGELPSVFEKRKDGDGSTPAASRLGNVVKSKI